MYLFYKKVQATPLKKMGVLVVVVVFVTGAGFRVS